jgi:hypothetical protein
VKLKVRLASRNPEHRNEGVKVVNNGKNSGISIRNIFLIKHIERPSMPQNGRINLVEKYLTLNK